MTNLCLAMFADKQFCYNYHIYSLLIKGKDVYVSVNFVSQGNQDAGRRRLRLRCSVVTLPRLRRLQLIRQTALSGPLVPVVLPSDGLHQQRHQPHPLQRNVRQVPLGLSTAAVLRQTPGAPRGNQSIHAGVTRNVSGGGGRGTGVRGTARHRYHSAAENQHRSFPR